MELITWTNEFSVNITELDVLPKKLLRIINQLFGSMLEGKAKEIINKIVEDSINYTDYHFTNEENLFDRHNYPGSHSHKIQHAYFKR